jgi:hypothetical protein
MLLRGVAVRTAALVAALAMIAVLGGLTVAVTVQNGPDPLTVLSLLVLALFGFGILGALRHRPPGPPS